MNNNAFKRAMVPILCILTLTIIACYLITTEYKKEKRESRLETEKENEISEAEEEVVDMESLEYAATGILIGKDTVKKALTIRPVEGGSDFLLEYDGTTSFLAKHGNSISIDQLSLGDIVDVNYSIHSGKLKTIQLSENAWTMTDISKFEINEKRKQMTVGDDTFKIDENLVISYGEEMASLMDITSLDTLKIQGVDRKVCSITVERGHGYIRLQNDAYFVGGWLEIGQDIIKPITSEMLVPVPEGTYQVKVSHKGYAGQKNMVIERDKESVLDLDEIEIEEVAIGHVQFNIKPDYAQLYVDDEMTDFIERVPLEYGIHKVHVELAGYESVDTNIKILSDYANVEISLEPLEDTTSSSSSTSQYNANASASSTAYFDTYTTTSSSVIYSTDATTSSSSSSSTAVVVSDTRQIYVEAPTGAEVYLDGNYIGIAPAHTNKVTGQHVLTLSKNGYVTKSYTINVDSDDRDVTFSFSDLIAE